MSKLRRWLKAAALIACAAIAGTSAAAPRSLTRTISDAITELDFDRARRWLERIDANSPAVVYERARLAVYLGDCELAATMLNVPQFLDSKEAAQLAALAQNCARATVAGYVMEDKERGIWLRMQDDADRALARASRDQAPLWLQEGIAKREETRWRAERPFDDPTWADVIARTALVSGRSVGIDKLGPSLAMLPTAEAASTAYAEVTSFMDFFLREAGEPGFRLLLADLRGYGAEGGADAALRSVTGYTLAEWKLRWEEELRKPPPPDARSRAHGEPTPEPSRGGKSEDSRELLRRVRLGDLLAQRGHARAAAVQYELALPQAKHEAAVRWRAARASLAAGDREGSERNLGALADIKQPHYGWLALEGRFQRDLGHKAESEARLLHALGLNPYSQDAACEGHFTLGGGEPDTLPGDPAWRALCEEASKVSRD